MSVYKNSNFNNLYHSPDDDLIVETSREFVILTFRRIPERLFFVHLKYIYIYIYIYIYYIYIYIYIYICMYIKNKSVKSPIKRKKP